MLIEVLTTLGPLQSLHEPLWCSFTLHATQYGLHLHFDNTQTNQIHSLNHFSHRRNNKE